MKKRSLNFKCVACLNRSVDLQASAVAVFPRVWRALQTAVNMAQESMNLHGREFEYAEQDLNRFIDFARALQQNEGLVRSWLAEGGLVVGRVAEQRMQMLHANCKTMLIWL